MVGMRDVAKKAGVSLSTVSLVVNGAGCVSDDMRERVAEAMSALNYVPNELARNLYHDRTNTVGVIVPTIRHPFFATLAAGLQRELSERGLRTMLCSTADSGTGEAEYVDMLRRHMMDGIVMAAYTEHAPDYWTSIGRPIVGFDCYLGEGIPSVGSDHEQGGRLIADLLIHNGSRHVAMVGGPCRQFHDLAQTPTGEAGQTESPGNTTFPTVRYYLTLERELQRAGIRCEYIEAGEVADFQGCATAMRELFDRFTDVDAVVSSDIGAACCVQEVFRRGMRVPQDVQVVAYDGTYLTDMAGLRLTAVCQDFDALAGTAVARMTDAIEGRPVDSAGDVIPVSLREADTTHSALIAAPPPASPEAVPTPTASATAPSPRSPMCCAPASPGCTTVSTSCRSSRRSTAPTPALIRSTTPRWTRAWAPGMTWPNSASPTTSSSTRLSTT